MYYKLDAENLMGALFFTNSKCLSGDCSLCFDDILGGFRITHCYTGDRLPATDLLDQTIL